MKVVLYGSPVLSFEADLRKRLPDNFEISAVDYDSSAAAINTAFSGAGAVVAVRYDQKIPSVPSLQLVQVPGVGCDEIDFSVLPKEVSLCNVHGHGDGVAEYVVLGMLQWCHRFFEADASFRTGSWERSSRLEAAPHRELSGCVVGIVGYGLIGRAVAAHLRGFGVTTLVCNRSKPELDEMHARSFGLNELREMVEQCDFLVVSIPLTDTTKDLFNKQQLNSMKADAVLINVSRGPIVNEAALFDALRDGQIGGAIIDVWYNYPKNADDIFAMPSRHDFAALPNVYMTPHISGWTEGTVQRRWSTIAENLMRLEKGEALLNVVKHEALQS